LATPTIGLPKSRSPKPTARSMARLGERWTPSVMVRLRSSRGMAEINPWRRGCRSRDRHRESAARARVPAARRALRPRPLADRPLRPGRTRTPRVAPPGVAIRSSSDPARARRTRRAHGPGGADEPGRPGASGGAEWGWGRRLRARGVWRARAAVLFAVGPGPPPASLRGNGRAQGVRLRARAEPGAAESAATTAHV